MPELRHYELPSDAGGERAAAIDSLLGSAKLNDLDPELYLRHVLERIADHPPGGPGLAFETWVSFRQMRLTMITT